MLARDEPHPSVRHCPLCGIAMQISHGEQGETRFDCQTCHSSIVERPVTRDAEHGEKTERARHTSAKIV